MVRVDLAHEIIVNLKEVHLEQLDQLIVVWPMELHLEWTIMLVIMDQLFLKLKAIWIIVEVVLMVVITILQLTGGVLEDDVVDKDENERKGEKDELKKD